MYHNDSTAFILINRVDVEFESDKWDKWTTFARIPEGLRPDREIPFPAYDNLVGTQSDSFVLQVRILADGSIQVWAFRDRQKVSVVASFTYPYKLQDSEQDLIVNPINFESADDLNPSGPTQMPLIENNENLRTLFNKLSMGIKNIRWLLKMIGTTDISNVADGTLTGALKELSASASGNATTASSKITTADVSYNAYGKVCVVSVDFAVGNGNTVTGTEVLFSGLPKGVTSPLLVVHHYTTNNSRRLILRSAGTIDALYESLPEGSYSGEVTYIMA